MSAMTSAIRPRSSSELLGRQAGILYCLFLGVTDLFLGHFADPSHTLNAPAPRDLARKFAVVLSLIRGWSINPAAELRLHSSWCR